MLRIIEKTGNDCYRAPFDALVDWFLFRFFSTFHLGKISKKTSYVEILHLRFNHEPISRHICKTPISLESSISTSNLPKSLEMYLRWYRRNRIPVLMKSYTIVPLSKQIIHYHMYFIIMHTGLKLFFFTDGVRD